MIGAILLATFLVVGPTAALAFLSRHLGRADRRELRNSETD